VGQPVQDQLKPIIGRVGDSAFEGIVGLLQSARETGTLFVHCGKSEKVIHFSKERVVLFENPCGEPLPSSTFEDAQKQLWSALSEVASWQGAPFEYLAGDAPKSFVRSLSSKVMPLSSYALMKGYDEHRRVRAAQAISPALEAEGVPPEKRVQNLVRFLEVSFSKNLFLRDLAGLLANLGAPRRAAVALRRLASFYSAWGAELFACSALEEAVRVCPADLTAMESLVTKSRANRVGKRAERAAEAACAELEKAGLDDRILAIFSHFRRSGELPELRLRVAGALARKGDSAQAVRELTLVASQLEHQGKRSDAARVHHRILDLDPSNSASRAKLVGRRGLRGMAYRYRHVLPFTAAALLLPAWVLWTSRPATALEGMRTEWGAQDLTGSIEILRRRASSLPTAAQVKGLAAFELDLYRAAYGATKKHLLEALAKLEHAPDSSTLGDLEALAANCAFTPLKERAREALAGLARRNETCARKAEEADRLHKAREYEKAFAACREAFEAAPTSAALDGLLVPVWMETVPEGADVLIDGDVIGKTPSWISLPLSSRAIARVVVKGFQRAEFPDAGRTLLARGEIRTRIALRPEVLFETAQGGGWVVGRPASAPNGIVVLGADGVLRGVGIQRGFASNSTFEWETVPEPSGPNAFPAFVAADQIIIAGRGAVRGHAALTGEPSWAWPPEPSESGAMLASTLGEGRIIAATGSRAAVLDAATGRPVVEFHLPGSARLQAASTAADVALYVTEAGDLVGYNVINGHQELLRRDPFTDAVWLRLEDGMVLVGRAGGAVNAFPLRGVTPVWDRPAGSENPSSCESSGNTTYLGWGAGLVECVETFTGKPVWQTQLEGSLAALSPGFGAAGEGVAAHVDRGGSRVIVVLDAATGKVLFEVSMGSAQASAVVFESHWAAFSSPSRGILVLKNLDS